MGCHTACMQIGAQSRGAVGSPRLPLTARVGVVMADLLSGVLSALPPLFLYLVGMHLWLSATGRGSDLVDEGFLAVAAVAPVLFLLLALLPARSSISSWAPEQTGQLRYGW